MSVDFYRGKKVCVTGACGLIGSYVTKLLVESEAKVRALTHKRPANEYTKMAHQVAFCDLTVPGQVHPAMQDVDVVVSCAGKTGGVGLNSIDPVGPATAIAVNVLHACHLAKVPLLGFLSSTTVYSPSEYPVVEDEPDTNEPGGMRPSLGSTIGGLYPLY